MSKFIEIGDYFIAIDKIESVKIIGESDLYVRFSKESKIRLLDENAEKFIAFIKSQSTSLNENNDSSGVYLTGN